MKINEFNLYYFLLLGISLSTSGCGERTSNPNSSTSAAPKISFIYPTYGPTEGGQSITIWGDHFVKGASVTIGGVPCTSVEFSFMDLSGNYWKLTCTTRASSPGQQDLMITNPDSQSAKLTNGYEYQSPSPIIDSFLPLSGPIAGGTSVRIEGRNFTQQSTVTIGDTPCTPVTFISSTAISCITGPRAATNYSRVKVTNDNAKSASSWYFQYRVPTPSVHRFEPVFGPVTGGTLISIFGENFLNGTRVSLGEIACHPVIFISPTEIRCTTQPTAYQGNRIINVTNPDGITQQAQNTFAYRAPPPPPRAPNHEAREQNERLAQQAQERVRVQEQNAQRERDRVARERAEQLRQQGTRNRIPIVQTHAQRERGRILREQVQAIRNEAQRLHAQANLALDLNLRGLAGSELEALILGRAVRLSLANWGHWINQINVNGHPINIERTPLEQVEAYVISSHPLAERTGLHVGDSLSQEQIQSHPQADILIEAMESGDITIERNAINPIFNPRPMNQEFQAYVDHLRELINENIERLNRGAADHWFMNPIAAHLDGTAFVNSDFGDLQAQSRLFSNLMNSMRIENETDFVQHMVEFATLFGHQFAAPKRGFIDSFTVLYVTKNFPSEGLMQSYYHFILRCGHLH